MTPNTVTQLAILVAFVLPGSVYQAVRARLAGEIRANRDLANRVLRALAASVVLDSVYGFVLGPTVVRLVGRDRTNARLRHWFLDHTRFESLLVLLLLFLFPAAAAYFAARRYIIGEWISHARERGPLGLTWGPHHARLRRWANAGLGWPGARSEIHGGLRFDPTPDSMGLGGRPWRQRRRLRSHRHRRWRVARGVCIGAIPTSAPIRTRPQYL